VRVLAVLVVLLRVEAVALGFHREALVDDS
jgi:hypothetical protein